MAETRTLEQIRVAESKRIYEAMGYLEIEPEELYGFSGINLDGDRILLPLIHDAEDRAVEAWKALLREWIIEPTESGWCATLGAHYTYEAATFPLVICRAAIHELSMKDSTNG